MNFYDQIDQIMDNFNFDSVHLVMVTLGVKVGVVTDDKSDFVTPTLPLVKRRARDTLKAVAFLGKPGSVYSDGFLARNSPSGQLSLQFIVEEWIADVD